MATVKDSIPHVVRTANDQRQQGLYNTRIGRLEQVNSRIRVLRFYLTEDSAPFRHLPGQYVDLQIPDVSVVGGFTITSPPQTALRLPAPTPSTTTPPSAATVDDPYFELAIQKSPSNPPAAFLWRDPPEIMNAPVSVRVGGNFTYPPLTLSREEFERIDSVVLVAGGVGINPIMSMLTAMNVHGSDRLGGMPKRVRVLYGSKRERQLVGGQGEEILFEKRLYELAKRWGVRSDKVDYKYCLFETSAVSSSSSASASKDSNTSSDDIDGQKERSYFSHLHQRMTQQDLIDALPLSEEQRRSTLVYVCGLPSMTDEFVDFLRKQPGLEEKRVLCEKWW